MKNKLTKGRHFYTEFLDVKTIIQDKNAPAVQFLPPGTYCFLSYPMNKLHAYNTLSFCHIPKKHARTNH